MPINTILKRFINIIDFTYTYGIIRKINYKFTNMNPEISKAKTITNFKKAKSLIKKIIKMMEEKEYCIDIMQQNLAVIGMLKSSHQMLMESHLNSCFKNSISSKNEKLKEAMLEEIVKVTKMVNK